MPSLGELARATGAELRGDPASRVSGLAGLEEAGPDQVSFLGDRHYRRHLAGTRAAAVILAEADAASCPVAALVAEDPYLGYARAAQLLYPVSPPTPGRHPSAAVSERAQVDESAWVGPQAVVEAGARIGPECLVGPGCVVGRDVHIGAATRLVANVTICEGVRIGRRVLVHPGAVLGSDGFGLANDHGVWVKIPQLGGLRVGDDVEIGANTSIDRGALRHTVIEDGVKLDNQIQVAHNVRIGEHTAVAGCVGIAGSAEIGRRCTLAGQVGVVGHLKIADDVHVTARSVVYQSVIEPGVYSSGVPLQKNRAWLRNFPRFRQLDEMARRIKALEARLRSLTGD